MKIDTTKYSAMVANASSATVISSSAFKSFIGDVKDVVDHNSPDGIYAADTGAVNASVITLSPVPPAYFAGMIIRFKVGITNTGASTVNVNALGAKSIKKNFNVDLAAGDIAANQIVEAIYDGTNFQLISTPNAVGSYLPLSGGTMTGGAIFNNNIVSYGKDSGGISRIIFGIDNSNQAYVGALNCVSLIQSNGTMLLTNGATQLKIAFGTGSPEGVVTAIVGSSYYRTDGGVGATHYKKTSGSGNIGWTAS